MSTGGITVFGWISGSPVQADLPYDANWVVAVPRTIYSEMSLAGTMIHQTVLKTYSAGTAQYNAAVPEAEAIKLQRIDEGTTTCIIGDGKNSYEASIDAEVSPKIRSGKRQVSMTATIIRKIF
jgi:hypothetical protein